LFKASFKYPFPNSEVGVDNVVEKAASGNVNIGKKTLFLMVAIIIIVVAVVAFFALFRQSSTNKVRITNIAVQPAEITGYNVRWPITVTIENQGSNDVSGVTLVVKMLGDGSELGRDTAQLSTLIVGDQRTMNMSILTDTRGAGPLETRAYVATILLDNIILDEARLP
jgi:hypothetical protein